jgi:hypothetical protein
MKPMTEVKWWPETEWQTAKLSPVISTTNGNPESRYTEAGCERMELAKMHPGQGMETSRLVEGR